MPYLKIQTNQVVDEAAGKQLLAKASAQVAEALGKPERYVMVDLAVNPSMIFGGSSETCAYVELKSIGLAESLTHDLSQMICSLLNTDLGIETERIYIEFINIPRKFWGWNNSTF